MRGWHSFDVLIALETITLLGVWLTMGWIVWHTKTTQEKNMATVIERLSGIETSLDEASTELLAELTKLREQLGNVITPEAEAVIARLETKAKALADVIPNA